jgi:hypothetical protein
MSGIVTKFPIGVEMSGAILLINGRMDRFLWVHGSRTFNLT